MGGEEKEGQGLTFPSRGAGAIAGAGAGGATGTLVGALVGAGIRTSSCGVRARPQSRRHADPLLRRRIRRIAHVRKTGGTPRLTVHYQYLPDHSAIQRFLIKATRNQ